MRPTFLFLCILWGWLLLGLTAAFLPILTTVWWITGSLALSWMLLDLLLLCGKMRIEVTRELPSFLALNQAQPVRLTIRNRHRTSLPLEVFDGLPPQMLSAELPWRGHLPAHGHVHLTYHLTPLVRGPQTLDAAHLRRTSLLRLWQRTWRSGPTHALKVYPNFEPVLRFNLLALSNRVEQMGILSLNRPGVSKEFHQLRDYQEGDSLSQIDWKATSRRATLISREYRQQRDQTLILAVDCGRRMRAMDGELTQFDHVLNSVLLLSHIALRQGDAVGIMGFGSQPRWLPPVKGPHQMPVLLNHLYDYQSSSEPTDFSDAARHLMLHQRRRAMIVFLTNLRSEDTLHLLSPLQELRKKHLLVLATLREQSLHQLTQQAPTTLDAAVTTAATHLYLEERAALTTTLRAQRLHVLDASAPELPLALVNEYLRIKKAGRL